MDLFEETGITNYVVHMFDVQQTIYNCAETRYTQTKHGNSRKEVKNNLVVPIPERPFKETDNASGWSHKDGTK